MMRVMDIHTADAYGRIPAIPAAAIQWLWYCDFWDWPRSGMVRYADHEYWVEAGASAAAGDAWAQRYWVIVLTPEQHAEEAAWQSRFEQEVGLHTRLDRPPPPMTEVRSAAARQRWYAAYRTRTPRDLRLNQVIGWFEER